MTLFNRILWKTSKRAYCRFWQARLAFTTIRQLRRTDPGITYPVLVFFIELFRRSPTIRITITAGKRPTPADDSAQACKYPECQCPFDMGHEFFCLQGRPQPVDKQETLND